MYARGTGPSGSNGATHVLVHLAAPLVVLTRLFLPLPQQPPFVALIAVALGPGQHGLKVSAASNVLECHVPRALFAAQPLCGDGPVRGHRGGSSVIGIYSGGIGDGDGGCVRPNDNGNVLARAWSTCVERAVLARPRLAPYRLISIGVRAPIRRVLPRGDEHSVSRHSQLLQTRLAIVLGGPALCMWVLRD
eukprot:scaffold28030_cov72-Phaeocystis_antarctica.AAC.10